MVKFRDASPGAAYEIAEGVTDAEEANKLGLAVVEVTPNGRPSAYGRYKDAPAGGPLGITVDNVGETKVVPGGTAGLATPAPAGDKGDLVNQNDPFIHGGTGEDSIHKDGAEPPVQDLEAERRAAVKAAEETNKTAKGK